MNHHSVTIRAGALEDMQRQRSLAFACAGMALVISAAVFFSNLVDHSQGDTVLTQMVAVHRQLLSEAQQDTIKNKQALAETQAALANIKQAQNPAKQ